MATAPTFASSPRIGMITLNNASGTSVSAAIITGVAAGTRIREIRINSGPTTAPGTPVCTFHVTDGVTTVVVDQVTMTSTANILQAVLIYNSLVLPSASWSIVASMSTAITSGGTIHITILGEDLT